MSITRINENISCLDLGATLVGILAGGADIQGQRKGAVLIDAGMHKNHAKIIEEVSGPVAAILHTHFHADHMGGSHYFSKKYPSRMFIPVKEISFAYTEGLNASLIFGGMPSKDMRVPFFRAVSVPAEPLPAETFTLEGYTIKTVDTSGHSVGHTSYIVDGVLFVGDAVVIPDMIDMHKILYFYDPCTAYEKLDIMKALDFETAVISHKAVVSHDVFNECVGDQKKHIERIKSMVYECVSSNTAEDTTRIIMKDLGIQPKTSSWLLTMASVKGYLAWLEQEGNLLSMYSENKGIIWEKN